MKNVILATVLAIWAMAGSAWAEVSGTARDEIAAAVYAAEATRMAAEQQWDADLKSMRAEVDRYKAAGQKARADLTRTQERFVAELERRDRAYAQEIAVFREAVGHIAETPEGVMALARFNAGDEVGALDILDRLEAARDDARRKRADIEQATDKRRIAVLALEARDRGKVSTESVIDRYETVTRLDPDNHWDWVELARLYEAGGQLDASGGAAKHALRTASDDRDRSVALNELGDVLVAQGDLKGARERFQEGLDIAQRLAQGDPSSATLQRDLSVSYDRLGDVLVAQGDLKGARERFQDGLDIFERLAQGDPSSAVLQRDLSVSFNKLGDVLKAQGDLKGARERFQDGLDIRKRLAQGDPSSAALQRDLSVSYERLGDVLKAQGDLKGARERFQDGLDIRKRLAQADPSSAALQRDLSVSYERLGDVLVAQGDLKGARERFQDGLDIRKRLAQADPSSAALQRDLSVSYDRLGDVLKAQGDLKGARERFQDGLDIRKRLAQADPSSAALQRDLIVSFVKISEVTGERHYAERAYQVALSMKARGILSPSDAWMIGELKRRASQ